MFASVLRSFGDEVASLKRVLQWQNNVRLTLTALSPALAPMALEPQSLATLQQNAPPRLDWQLFDHYAAITRLYALYEKAVVELVEEYVQLVPTIAPAYTTLDDSIRVHHRVGVGHILTKWAPQRTLYSHLAESAIVDGLAQGLRGEPYRLLSDAFLTDSDNYRPDVINRIFQKLGFEGAFYEAAASTSVTSFFQQSAQQETPASLLTTFVIARNEASHGTFSSVFALSQILIYADFLVLLVSELACLLRTRLVRAGIAAGCSTLVGKILNRFSNNIVGVEASATATIAVGDEIYSGKKRVDIYTVRSLQIAGQAHTAIPLTPGIQFGMGLDHKPSNAAQIYFWNPPP